MPSQVLWVPEDRVTKPMELFTVGYEGRTLPHFVRLLKENDITRLVAIACS